MANSEWFDLAQELTNYLTKLKQASKSVGDLFYDEITAEKINVLSSYMTGYGEVLTVLLVVIENYEKSDVEEFNNKIKPLAEKLNNSIKTITDLLGSQQYVQLADFMCHELTVTVENANDVLKEYAK